MNPEERYLEEFLEFLPKKKRRSAKVLMQHLMLQPQMKIRNNSIILGRKRIGHISTVLVALFQPKLHEATEENMKLFRKFLADGRARAKAGEKKKGKKPKKVENLIVCPPRGVPLL